MSYRPLPLAALRINRANDRHGELENETAAIAWLFNNRELHMKNLAKDIVETGEVYTPPLVASEGDNFIVFDGNRRVTCMKLLDDPRKAPTGELQKYFGQLRSKWDGEFPEKLHCQVETDRDRIDDILFRRHTGTQSGVGQSTWDDRMKANFVNRTGKGGSVNVAEQIESLLSTNGLLPTRRTLPRSTMNRLLSSETFRNRVGVTVTKGRFNITHQEDIVLGALRRIAKDLAEREVVLGDIWDIDGKRSYLDRLEKEGLLPTAAHRIVGTSTGAPSTVPGSRATNGAHPHTPPSTPAAKANASTGQSGTSQPLQRNTLIPKTDYGLPWPGRLQRHRAIWDELQHHLILDDHPNAIAVLFRVLLELSIENYINQVGVVIGQNDKLAMRVTKVAEDLHTKNKISAKYLGEIKKFQHADRLISADTLNRYVHSPDFAPSTNHLTALWDALSSLVVQGLNV